MRIKIGFLPNTDYVRLPIHYNEILQGFIYQNLDQAISKELHKGRFKYGQRKYNLFTFSRLLGKTKKFDKKNNELIYNGRFFLKVAASDEKILESFVMHLLGKKIVRIGRNLCRLASVEVEMPPTYQKEIVVRTISPIVIYTTFVDDKGKNKTYYYHPGEKDWVEKLINNLLRKGIASGIVDNLSDRKDLKISVEKKIKRVVTFYHGKVIEGWDVVMKLSMPKEIFFLAYDVGMGSRNSQGFGMIEVVGSR